MEEIKNLGTAPVFEFRVKNAIAYNLIIKTFGGYIFRRKGEDGNYYIQADREQQAIIRSMGITLMPVKYD